MIADSLSYSFEHIKAQKMRALLTIIGIVIGVAAIFALISLSAGMENAIVDTFAKMGINSIRIAPANLRGPPAGDKGFTIDDAEFVEKIKSVEYVNQVLLQFSSVSYHNEEQFLMINGYDTTLEGKGFIDADVTLIDGRFFEPGEKTSVIVGYNVATDTFRKDIYVGNSIEIENKKFRVIGLFERTGTPVDNSIYAPIAVSRELFNKTDLVNIMIVKLKPGFEQVDVVPDLQRKLKKRLGDENFEIFTPEQILGQLNTILGVVQFILGGIAAIALLVGGIGIMNSMFTAVLERTREIGVMKAVGARNSDVLNIFLVESGLIGAFGGLIGVIIGFSIAKMVEIGARLAGFGLLTVRFDVTTALFALAFAFGLGMLSGLVPAYRAAKLKPVDALRYE